jgi:hypothetical protein
MLYNILQCLSLNRMPILHIVFQIETLITNPFQKMIQKPNSWPFIFAINVCDWIMTLISRFIELVFDIRSTLRKNNQIQLWENHEYNPPLLSWNMHLDYKNIFTFTN